ncbi:MAG: dihydroorotate dehydrogenase electron transfer subunit [Clostridia bacterium]|nr:dihydroorotate dehydrogenase electron transfer subunit [Clostridia bacterium]
MNQGTYSVLSNINIAKDVYKMILGGDTSQITAPGQFINIKLDGLYLRRPISICDFDENSITIIYKVVGAGTELMSRFEAYKNLDVLVGLGNGFDISKSGDRPLLIGGGVGVPPMYYLCKALLEKGVSPTVILGFNSAEDVFYEKKFKKLGVPVYVATVDGSCGIKGFVTDVVPLVGEYSYFYTCGPLPMFKAVYKTCITSGQFSFEERMGCGFGACMGCTCKTKYGNKRICKDGPVLEKEEIIW